MPQDLPTLAFPSADDWDAWLAENHAASDGLWIRIAKKASGIPTVAYPEVLEVAISHGWIDGQRRALDDTWFLQKFTPRRARSRWSKINREKAVALIEAGRMKPAGLLEVERAKADGRWDAAYDSSRTATVPDDLRAALDASPVATAGFEALNAANRYSILYQVHDAKRPETRARRIAKYVAMLERGEKPHG